VDIAQLHQRVTEFNDVVVHSVWWNALLIAAATGLLIVVAMVCGRNMGTRILYLFLAAGVAIFAYHVAAEESWNRVYTEYAPHFGSEILVTFIAVALLERSIAYKERWHQMRRNVLGFLRFYVRFCQQHDLRFSRLDGDLLADELNSFNGRKERWRVLMTTEERALFRGADDALNRLVRAIQAVLAEPDIPGATQRERNNMLTDLHALSLAYQECRTAFWRTSDPDELPHL